MSKLKPQQPSPLLAYIAAGLASASVLTGLWAIYMAFIKNYSMPIDLMVYHRAATFVATGHSPYSDQFNDWSVGLKWLYTPFASLVVEPLAWVPVNMIQWVWSIVAIAIPALLIVAVMYRPVVARIATRRNRIIAWVVVSLFALTVSPVVDALSLGQIGTLLAAITLFDLAAPAAWRGFGRIKLPQGVLVGIAGAIKLVPLLVVPYWLVTKQWKAAITASATTFGAWLIAWAALPADSITYFLHGGILRAQTEIGTDAMSTDNQSLQGMLMRALGTYDVSPALKWSVTGFAVILGLSLAWHAHRRHNEIAAATLVGLTTVLASPISWVHHAAWIIAVPAAIIYTVRTDGRVLSVMQRPLRLLVAGALAVMFAVPPAQYDWSPIERVHNFLIIAVLFSVVAILWSVEDNNQGTPNETPTEQRTP
jgi:alpha-1,2-mannosyltransferase